MRYGLWDLDLPIHHQSVAGVMPTSNKQDNTRNNIIEETPGARATTCTRRTRRACRAPRPHVSTSTSTCAHASAGRGHAAHAARRQEVWNLPAHAPASCALVRTCLFLVLRTSNSKYVQNHRVYLRPKM
jgi:hypothetical protein